VRNAKSKGIPNISTMIEKLRAMIQAEENGFEDLARKIARGDVIPEAIYAKQLLYDNEVENPIKA
jgi:hypothetical protein